MSNSGTHHAVDYVELHATDLEASKRFYAAAFGWRFTDYGPGYAGFVDGARGEREAGGIAKVDAVTSGGPLIVIYSADLDATLAAVRDAGGEIVAPIFDFPGGRRFEFVDPAGLRLGVWTQG